MSLRSTINLNHGELRVLLIDTLRRYTDSIEYVSGSNPYLFKINGKAKYIYIRNIHQTGQKRENQDECRIQINRSPSFNTARRSKFPVLFLGYLKDSDVFTAWEPTRLKKRINIHRAVSVYSRFSTLEDAAHNGISSYTDSAGQTIVSFHPEYLGLYLDNYSRVHASDSLQLRKLIGAYQKEVTKRAPKCTITVNRKKYRVVSSRYKRNAAFQKAISAAYQSRCAFCGVDLDLVEAAHIIPHAHKQGTDLPSNGICLCSLHHTAYDKGLLYIDKKYRIRINNNRLSYLRKISRAHGGVEFQRGLLKRMRMPISLGDRPSMAFIDKGNLIRGVV